VAGCRSCCVFFLVFIFVATFAGAAYPSAPAPTHPKTRQAEGARLRHVPKEGRNLSRPATGPPARCRRRQQRHAPSTLRLSRIAGWNQPRMSMAVPLDPRVLGIWLIWPRRGSSRTCYVVLCCACVFTCLCPPNLSFYSAGYVVRRIRRCLIIRLSSGDSSRDGVEC